MLRLLLLLGLSAIYPFRFLRDSDVPLKRLLVIVNVAIFVFLNAVFGEFTACNVTFSKRFKRQAVECN